jgi:CRP/FNR family transcriptional regulator, cyclic AMP receptor protein
LKRSGIVKLSINRLVNRLFQDDQNSEDLAFFREITLFHGLHNRQLRRVLQAMQKRKYYAGEVVFQEGQEGKAVFVIRSGAVELARRGVHDKEKVLARVGSGQIFGEMALLEHQPRTATARVTEDGELYLLYTATLDSLLHREPAIGVVIMKNIAVVLSALVRRYTEDRDKERAAGA